MAITLDPNISKSLNDGMKSSEAIELPFPTPFIWWTNGQASYKQQGGALYFGGWVCKADQMNEVLTLTNSSLPAGMIENTIATKEGAEFQAFASRSLMVAPIAMRKRYLNQDGKKSSPHFENGEFTRQHMQVLVFLAEIIEKKFHPWGPAVLTAKGYQAKKLQEAFTTWDKITAQSRNRIAPGVPAWCFYLSVGTFGKERVVEQVGKPGAQSPITPINCYVPPELTDEKVEALFVGQEIAAIMAARKDEAAEWLGAWKAPGTDAAQNGASADEYNGPTFPHDDEIPF